MELLERERFLSDLDATLDHAASGVGRTVLVTGEAGIGKTALVEHFAAKHRPKTRVLWGVCDALFTPRPLGPLHDIAHQMRTDLLALLSKRASRTAIFTTVLEDLQAGTRPSIVVFEDIHWADEATLDLIKFLGRRINRARLLLILTYRDDELGPRHPLRLALGDLPAGSVTRMALPALSEAAVDAMARRVRRPFEGLHAVTGGNPFFVTEVLATASPAVPATVRDAVMARAARLSPKARELLELLSVAPTRMERWLLDAILGPEPAVLDECAGAGMLRIEEAVVAFRHELARRAIEDGLPPARRQQLHAVVLRAMLDRGPDAVHTAHLAHHASGARDADAVLRYAPAAAKQASSLGAHRAAAEHYATALLYAHRLASEEHAALLEGQSYECYLTGETQLALEARSEAIDRWRELGHGEKEGDNLRWMSRIHWLLGSYDEAKRYALMAMDVLERLPPGRELAMAYSNRAQLHMLAQETTDAVHWGTRAIQLAQSFGDHETLVHALNNVGVAEAFVKYDRGCAKLEESLKLALMHGFEEHAVRAINNLATLSVRHRQHARAAAYLNEGVTFCAERDMDAWVANMRPRRAQLRLQQGDWAGAVDDAGERLRIMGGVHSRIIALVVLAQVRARRGERGVQELLNEARGLLRVNSELQDVAPVAAACAEAAWLHGDLEACITAARPGHELAVIRSDPWLLGELSFWMWRGGALKEPPDGIALPFALHITGDWRGAAAEWERLGCPYERALALAEGDEAAQRAALGILDRLGAVPAAAIVRRRLAAQGVRVPRGARSSTRRNPAGLTNREVEVLLLVAKGLQNAQVAERLFLSPRTVDNHVSAILTKLNVHTRTEAVAVAQQLGLATQEGPS